MKKINYFTTSLLTAALLPFSAYADTIISTDTTQNGGTFAIAPPVLRVTHGSNDPTLTLTGGASASWEGATVVGAYNGESGNLEIRNGSTLTNSGTGYIGSYGSAPVNRGDSYLGLNANATGNALVTGANSIWSINSILYVGDYGKGNLRIENGGSVSSGAGDIGRISGSEGNVTVTGAGSNWTISGGTGTLRVGVYGKGNLRIENGGSISSANGIIGNSASTGSATITGAGSNWTNSAILRVGQSAKGELHIENGGSVSSANGIIGYDGFAAGSSVTATGSDSQWIITGDLTVGRDSSGNTLSIQDGALVKADGVLAISQIGGSVNNYIRLDGGYLALQGNQETTLTNFIAAERFQLWDEDNDTWMTGTLDDFLITYHTTNESGQAATGYGNLGGYTTITTIPEPTGVLLVLFGMSVCLTRRRRTRGGRA